MDILGVDEAGRGSVLGPMVIAGVIVPEKMEKVLERMGVKDSKRLTANRRTILSRKLKKMFGKFGYFFFALKGIFKKINSYDIKYIIDNKEYSGKYSFFFITNSSRIGGINDIYSDVLLDDNKFEVAFLNVKSKRSIIKTFYNIRTKNIKDIPNIKYYQTDNIKIIFDKVPVSSWCIDGEELETFNNSFEFEIDHRCNMLLPKKNLVKLFKKR